MSMRVATFPTNTSGWPVSQVRSAAGPFTWVPSWRTPDASTGLPPSVMRHWPTASKFSSENPSGSMLRWQEAHTGLRRCDSTRSRTDVGFVTGALSSSAGTFGGGIGSGSPISVVRMYLPRMTGEVRVATDVTDSTLP